MFATIPTACIFTSVPLPESNSVNVTTGIPSDSQMTDAEAETQMTNAVAETQITDAVAETQITDAVAETQMTDAEAETQMTNAEAETQMTDTEAETQMTNAVAETQITDAVAETQMTDAEVETQMTNAVAETQITDAVAETQITDTVAETQITDAEAETQMTNAVAETQMTDAEAETQMTDTAVENQTTNDQAYVISDVIPVPLTTTLYCEHYNQMNSEELEKEAERVFCSMSISVRDAETIQRATIMQQSCAQWREQRNGRITASLFHDVYVRKESTHPDLLLKRIMGYEQNDLSYIPAINWGIQNENSAREQYTTVMSTRHNAFTCSLTGLWINPLYPHMGVSPDGITDCQCCGEGILEIKCPHSARHVDPNSLTSTTCAFLTSTGCLNHKHRYYTQVQGQLMVTGRLFCDFLIWTPVGYKIERVYPDVHFWEKLEKKLTSFYVINVLPEIMTRRLKQELEMECESDKENVYCICQKGSSGRMIACENRSCQYQWFHYQCVGIKRAPKGDWYCPTCKKSKYTK